MARRVGAPVVATLTLLVLGRPVPALVLAVVVAVLVHASLLAPTRMRALDHEVARLGRAAATAVSLVAGALVEVAVVIPLWAAGRVVGFAPLEPGWATARSAWLRTAQGPGHAPDAPAARARGAAGRELQPSRKVRRRGRVRLLAVVPVLALVVAIDPALVPGPWRDRVPNGVRHAVGTEGPPVLAGYRWNAYPFAHEPWAFALFKELDAVHYRDDPTLGVVLLDHRGTDVNIVGGRRRTYAPAGRPRLTVWMFGGSTLYGIGQRDTRTIPSDIARASEADGLPIRVVNFGVSGYVNWQENLQLQEALTSGQPPPDLVVFYDGANETGLAYERMAAGDLRGDTIEGFPVNDVQRTRLRAAVANPQHVPEPQAEANRAALGGLQYGRGVTIERRLLAGYGVPGVWFWQPILVSKRQSPADQRLFAALGASRRLEPQMRASYAQMLAVSRSGAIDVSGALDAVTEPVYLDWSHVNESAARVIADALYARLRPQLRALAHLG